ncbi:MAG: SAM-dependent methyltransferase [Ruminococcaceae bacterium]|nr:SAM-dependent methyltransferase [Oscillospiraceae bacterium]
MWIAKNWKDYELIDAEGGERLEKWGKYRLVRPDPQVIWKGDRGSNWKRSDARYLRSRQGGGAWQENALPESWNIRYEPLDLTFHIKPMGFKHTGLFPEQAFNWEKTGELIRKSGRKINLLNLFAYTGGATVAAAKAGASVCHVDASKGMVAHAKTNAELSGLKDAPIRYIVDDCKKFIEREIRRGHKYEAVILDPPSYGRGPNGEVWKLEESISEFISLVSQVLSDEPLFVLVNSYTTGLSPSAMGYLLNNTVKAKYGGRVECDELCLPVTSRDACLPCGSSAYYIKEASK